MLNIKIKNCVSVTLVSQLFSSTAGHLSAAHSEIITL